MLKKIFQSVSSVENYKGAINTQRCSVENQKGTVAVQVYGDSALLDLNSTSSNSDCALLALN